MNPKGARAGQTVERKMLRRQLGQQEIGLRVAEICRVSLIRVALQWPSRSLILDRLSNLGWYWPVREAFLLRADEVIE